MKVSLFYKCLPLVQSKAILADLNLYPVRGCINHLRDKNNKHYFIPNYCINDPYFEKSLVVDDEVKETLIQVKYSLLTNRLCYLKDLKNSIFPL